MRDEESRKAEICDDGGNDETMGENDETSEPFGRGAGGVKWEGARMTNDEIAWTNLFLGGPLQPVYSPKHECDSIH